MRRSDWGIVASRLETWHADSEKHSAFWLEVRTHLPEGWRIPPEPQWGEWNHWLLPLCPPSQEAAIASIAKLRSRGVGARLMYLYSPEAARSYGYIGDCPEAELLSRLVFLLPSHGGLTTSERQHIVECVRLLDPLNDLSHNRRQKSLAEPVSVIHSGCPSRRDAHTERDLPLC
jgi:dTDP-4-amino-4,6-dideoxygalactose transaminase